MLFYWKKSSLQTRLKVGPIMDGRRAAQSFLGCQAALVSLSKWGHCQVWFTPVRSSSYILSSMGEANGSNVIWNWVKVHRREEKKTSDGKCPWDFFQASCYAGQLTNEASHQRVCKRTKVNWTGFSLVTCRTGLVLVCPVLSPLRTLTLNCA